MCPGMLSAAPPPSFSEKGKILTFSICPVNTVLTFFQKHALFISMYKKPPPPTSFLPHNDSLLLYSKIPFPCSFGKSSSPSLPFFLSSFFCPYSSSNHIFIHSNKIQEDLTFKYVEEQKRKKGDAKKQISLLAVFPLSLVVDTPVVSI